MELFKLPFFAEIEDAQNILIAGAGGGFDIFCGLPLYFALRSAGKQVHLANLSFSSLYASKGRRLSPALVEVTEETEGNLRYFPERHLAQWFQQRGEPVPIYGFDRTGVLPLLSAYQWLVENLKLDTILLVDGGTDSLMRGDEVGLGTPEEDIASIAAVLQTDVPHKLLACLGFGVDTYHGICHAQFLEAVADITQNGGFLGVWSLTREMPEALLYRQATEAVLREMQHHPSIVNTSILAALEGRFGDYHSTYRTEGSTLFINPLMTLYWSFHLEAVAHRILYLEPICWTSTYQDIIEVIQMFRIKHKEEIKDWANIPV